MSTPVLNVFQTVAPRAEPKDPPRVQRKPGFVMGRDGKYCSSMTPTKAHRFHIAPPLTQEERLERDMRNSSIDSMAANPLRKKNAVRNHKAPVFAGV